MENVLIAYARYFPLRRGKLRLVNALWRTAAGRSSHDRVATLRHGGFRIPANLNEMLQRQFYYFGTYFLEDEILDCWERFAKQADTVFDIGANAGIFSLAALAANSRAIAHAFEPTPEIAARLRATVALNDLDRLFINEVAVGAKDGSALLQRWRGAQNDNEGMNFILSAGDSGEAVRIISLDSYCTENGVEKIDLLKIDIQGNEPSAFAGAKRMLDEGRIGAIFAELNWDAARGHDDPGAKTAAILAEAGFLFSPPGHRLEWRKAGEWMRGHFDVIAIHSDTKWRSL